MKDKWIRAIRREIFVPTKNARVCSRHFHESCYSTEPRDSNTHRKHLGLKHEKLKPDVVPTIFTDSPAYLSVIPTLTRSTSLSTATTSQNYEARSLPFQSFKFTESVSKTMSATEWWESHADFMGSHSSGILSVVDQLMTAVAS
ncbi:unnamed protein product [Lepeophtheirus salmonis]|uniref:(salmon louse) hypothetical protein n=1 Tax=Lepeophtheirus salmonis TaxID=72036 RepID=A0A7R8CX86_LEPSM|nr:unnamed protein product [Lepeophtheirus salmonis]CAF2958281.1 unnamed protein product [Lepeophtheirus salmonis]